MAVAHVATVKQIINATASATHSSNARTFSAGSLAICVVITYANGGVPPAVLSAVSSTGGSFAIDKTVANSISRVTILSKANMAAGSQACNLTFADGTTDYVTAFLLEVSGAATSSPQDGAGAATGTDISGSAAATGTFTGVGTSFYVCGVGSASGANPATFTPGSGWTVPSNGSETDGAANLEAAVEYKANPGTTSHNGDFTVSSSAWVIAAMAYLVAGSTPPPVDHRAQMRAALNVLDL